MVFTLVVVVEEMETTNVVVSIVVVAAVVARTFSMGIATVVVNMVTSGETALAWLVVVLVKALRFIILIFHNLLLDLISRTILS